MGNICAHNRGDPRNIFVMLEGELVEVTPAENNETSAMELARGMGQRLYLRKSEENGGWAVYPAYWSAAGAVKRKWFPTQDAAVMYAALMGGMR